MLEDSLSSDGELVQRVLAGDTNSFVFLINRYERLARSIAVSYVGDCTQQTTLFKMRS